MSEEDYKLSKIKLAKAVTQLCVDFMKECGAENMGLRIASEPSTLTTDSGGRVCYGKVLRVDIETWNNEEFDDDYEEED